jgi:hypothetical protein
MVRTTWRCGTGARTSFWSHSAHRSWRFFSQDGQNDLPRHENGQSTLVRHAGHQSLAQAVFDEATAHEPSQHPLDHGTQGPMLPGKADGPGTQQLLEVLLDKAEPR